ncbi:MAG: SRPBCC family protein [Bacteroidota bacterium]
MKRVSIIIGFLSVAGITNWMFIPMGITEMISIWNLHGINFNNQNFTAMTQDTTFNMELTRVIDTPLEQVWNAWSDENLVKRWWGPTGFTAPVAKMDFREGGRSLVCMRSPDGVEIYNTWTYKTIEAHARIEYTLNFTDSKGNILEPSTIGLPPSIPVAVPHVVTFKKVGRDQTEIVVVEHGYQSADIVQMSKIGMEQCLDKMADALKNK